MGRPVKAGQKYLKIIELFNRCEQNKCLPKAGGLLNQSEKMMIYFDVIRREYDDYKNKQMQREQRLAEVKRKLKKR